MKTICFVNHPAKYWQYLARLSSLPEFFIFSVQANQFPQEDSLKQCSQRLVKESILETQLGMAEPLISSGNYRGKSAQILSLHNKSSRYANYYLKLISSLQIFSYLVANILFKSCLISSLVLNFYKIILLSIFLSSSFNLQYCST